MKTVFCASGGVEAPVGGLMYEGTGSGVNAFVTEKIEERGGRIFTSTGATKLVIDDNGAVVGALADGPDKSGMYIWRGMCLLEQVVSALMTRWLRIT